MTFPDPKTETERLYVALEYHEQLFLSAMRRVIDRQFWDVDAAKAEIREALLCDQIRHKISELSALNLHSSLRENMLKV